MILKQESGSSFRTGFVGIAWILILQMLVSCSDSSKVTAEQSNTLAGSNGIVSIKKQQPSDSMASLLSVVRIRNDSVRLAMQEVSASATVFLAEPSIVSLQQARLAWSQMHLAWLQSRIIDIEALDNGLTDNLLFEHPDELSLMRELLFFVDAAPIEEGFLDSIEGYPDSGLIMDMSISIDEKTLRQQHGITAAEEACLGFHPLEYFLWGRQVDDFSANSSKDPVLRRRTALAIVLKLLEKDSNLYLDLSESLFESVLPSLSEPKKLVFLLATLKLAIEKLSHSLQTSSIAADHSSFSLTNQENTAFYIKRIAHLIKKPVDLYALMESLDSEKAELFITILDQSLAQPAETNLTSEQTTALIEPVSSLLSLTEDFISKGDQQQNNENSD